MCDTMVALGNSTVDGRVILAKNADRQPNEHLLTIRVPRRSHPPGSKLQTTYLTIDQAEETYEAILLKPHWIWGAEMGGNEYGLNIGNEAVFTREPKAKEGLLGMDMLRLALERCKNCQEALDLMVELLDRYGQGGNCGFEKPFTYHNAFLLADRQEAWVLETAGSYWAALKVKDIYSISNRLSIGRDYDLAHPRLVDHAIEKGWCKGPADFHFARCYSEPVFTYFSGSAKRQEASREILSAAKGRIDIPTILEALRSHNPAYTKKPYQKSSVSSVCMHAGFFFGDQTTGCYVAKMGNASKDGEGGLTGFRGDSYWISGGGPSCLSLMKPYFLAEGGRLAFSEEEKEEAMLAWRKREEIHRLVLENRIDARAFQADRDQLEVSLLKRAEDLEARQAGLEEHIHLANLALEEEEILLTSYKKGAQDKKARIRGNPYFRRYWKRMNRHLREKDQKRG